MKLSARPLSDFTDIRGAVIGFAITAREVTAGEEAVGRLPTTTCIIETVTHLIRAGELKEDQDPIGWWKMLEVSLFLSSAALLSLESGPKRASRNDVSDSVRVSIMKTAGAILLSLEGRNRYPLLEARALLTLAIMADVVAESFKSDLSIMLDYAASAMSQGGAAAASGLCVLDALSKYVEREMLEKIVRQDDLLHHLQQLTLYHDFDEVRRLVLRAITVAAPVCGDDEIPGICAIIDTIWDSDTTDEEIIGQGFDEMIRAMGHNDLLR